MSNVYAVGDATYRRHITYDGTHTLCGLEAGQHEPLALPVNCDECRTENGKLIKRQAAAQASAPRCETIGCAAPATHRLTWSMGADTTVSDKVCEPCGEGYASRPSLKATLKPLEG